MVRGGIGLVGYDSFHFVVERHRALPRVLHEKLDFKEVARSGRRAHRAQRPAVGRLRRGRRARLRLDAATGPRSKAARYLRRHPAGVMSLSFRVKSLETAMKPPRRARRHVPRRSHRRRGRPRRPVPRRRDRDAARRRRVPLRRARSDYRAFAPGFDDSGPGSREPAGERLRHPRGRSRHVERAHDAADHRVGTATCSASSRSGRSASTRRTSPRRRTSRAPASSRSSCGTRRAT